LCELTRGDSIFSVSTKSRAIWRHAIDDKVLQTDVTPGENCTKMTTIQIDALFRTQTTQTTQNRRVMDILASF
jgi:hypothetical protein